MGKLIVAEQLSLDGVMQAPGSPDEDRSGGFGQGGWYAPYFDDVGMGIAADGIADTGAYLFGRRTYEIMASHWPNVPEGDPFADTLNDLPKYVASTTLDDPSAWRNSALLEGDVPTAVADLKRAEAKNIVVLGSGQLVRALLDHDLVDEVTLMIAPLVLGGGKRLFEGGGPTIPLRLVDVRTTGTGVIVAAYRRDAR
jgi:dihydrofolate reductase